MRRQGFSEMRRCPDCAYQMGEKIEANPDAQLQAIEDWLDRWARGEIESPLVVKQREIVAERKAYEEQIRHAKGYWKADHYPKPGEDEQEPTT